MKIKNGKYIIKEDEYLNATRNVLPNNSIVYEIPLKRISRKQITKNEILELKQRNLNINEICGELGCSYNLLRKKLLEFFGTTKVSSIVTN